MKKMIISVLALVFATTYLAGAAFEKTAQSRSASAVISSEKPLSAGSNTLDIAIKLKQGDTGIKEVNVKAFMPAMPGMPAMESKSNAALSEDGSYHVTLDMSMSGTWQLQIFIVPEEGKKMRIKSSVNVN
jgi:nitrogen fixation protein FixH